MIPSKINSEKIKLSKIPDISVISPVYGCKKCIYELYPRLKETLEKISAEFEIILINDLFLSDCK